MFFSLQQLTALVQDEPLDMLDQAIGYSPVFIDTADRTVHTNEKMVNVAIISIARQLNQLSYNRLETESDRILYTFSVFEYQHHFKLLFSMQISLENSECRDNFIYYRSQY